MTVMARPTGSNELYVFWDGEDADYFELRKSTSPEGPFEIIAPSLAHPFFIDDDVNFHDPAIRYYYQVKGYVGGSEVMNDETDPASPLFFTKDYVSNAVIYESRKILQVMNNPKAFVLLKRREGKPCPNCWNPITKKVKFANCEVCNGTGKLEGYYPPIPVNISHDIANQVNANNMMDGDKAGLTDIKAWISNRPLLSPGDVIVDARNRRFIVDSVMPRTKSSYIHRQILQMSYLEKGHPAYNVDINFEVSTLLN